MTSNLSDLLRQRTVEGDRLEYKADWNPNTVCGVVINRLGNHL
ncbi:MAG: hypothetical protein Q9M26_08900 [Mariprofundales bacterium]|nr:hypothetical protein [Mariprofundales bacterium]